VRLLPLPRTLTLEPRPDANTLAAAAAAVCAAAFVGFLVSTETRFLSLGGEFDLRMMAALAAGVAVSTVILIQPRFGLEVLAVFVYLNLSQVLVRHHALPSLLQLLAVPLFLGAWLHRHGDRMRLATRPLTLTIVAYVLVVIASTLVARDAALADVRAWDHVKALAVYLLVALLGGSRALIRRGVWALLGSGALLGIVVLVQVVLGDYRHDYLGLGRIKLAQIYGEVFEPRIAGPLGDPNYFAQVLVLLVPLSLLVVVGERRRVVRGAALAAGALVTVAAVLTYSRGGALTLAAVLGLYLLVRPPRPKHLLIGVAVLVCGALLAPSGFARRLETIAEVIPGQGAALRPDSSFAQRKLLTTVAWRIFLDHPLMGVGVGNYTVHFDEYAQQVGSLARDYEQLGERHYPHSLYLEIAAETGLVGLAAFGAVLVACFAALRSARRAALARGDEATVALCRGFEIAVVAYLLASVFLHGDYIRYLWMLFGFAAALEHVGASREAQAEASHVGT
jgi:putative inorganic carbon (hco3(-)) transporter